MANSKRHDYRHVSPYMWGDKSFIKLSRAHPNAQTLWVYLLTGPHTTALPGLSVAGPRQLAEALGWPYEDFSACMAEITRRNMAWIDAERRVIAVPNAPRYDPPASPNVVLYWRKLYDDVPDCDVKRRYRLRLQAFLRGFGRSFVEAFSPRAKRDRARPSPNPVPVPLPDPVPEDQTHPQTPAPKPRGRTEAPPWLAGFRDRALKEWQSRGGDGEWTKADFVAIAEAVKGYHKRDPATAEARLWASWMGFLDDPWDGFAGHYPRQWGHQAARWPARASPNLPKRTAGNVAAVNEYLEGVQRERKALGAGQTAAARHSPGGDG